MTDILWEDPPESTEARVTAAAGFVAALKAHPGRWARYHSENAGAGAYLKSRYGCEVRTQRHETGVHVWARWPVPS